MNKINKKFENFCHSLDLIAGALLAVLTITVLIEVVGRYFFHHPFTLTFDISLFLFPYIIMISMVTITLYEQHLGLDYFKNKMRGRLRGLIVFIINSLTLLFLLFMFISSTKLSIAVLDSTAGTWKISQSLYYLPLVLSFGVLFFMILYRNISTIINSNKKNRLEE